MTTFNDVRSALVCLTDGRMLTIEAADLIAAYTEERVAAERERIAQAIEAKWPTLHNAEAITPLQAAVWAFGQAAAKIARNGGELPDDTERVGDAENVAG